MGRGQYLVLKTLDIYNGFFGFTCKYIKFPSESSTYLHLKNICRDFCILEFDSVLYLLQGFDNS